MVGVKPVNDSNVRPDYRIALRAPIMSIGTPFARVSPALVRPEFL